MQLPSLRSLAGIGPTATLKKPPSPDNATEPCVDTNKNNPPHDL